MAGLHGVLMLGLMLSIAACGSAGSNEDDDNDDATFPEPPGRPGSVQVDSTNTNHVSSQAARVFMHAAAHEPIVDERRH